MTTPWMELSSGGSYAFGVDRPDVPGTEKNFFPVDLAHALSQINRFNGHSAFPYSVAQHSVLVSDMLAFCPVAALAGLMHDAHEALVGDLVKPFKQTMCSSAQKWFLLQEASAKRWLGEKLKVSCEMSASTSSMVGRADLVALATERRDVMLSTLEWDLPHPPLPKKIKPLSPKQAARMWFSRFERLTKAP